MKYYILFSMKIINAVVFCLSLQAADTTEHDLLRICGSGYQEAFSQRQSSDSLYCRLRKYRRVRKSEDKEDKAAIQTIREIDEKKNEVFALVSYPADNPFITFAQKQANNSSETAIKTNLAIRKFVSGLLVLQCLSQSCNNLKFVQNGFLDSFTDAELLKGRIGSEQQRKDLIFQRINNFTQGQDKKSGKEREFKPHAGNDQIAEDANCDCVCLLAWLSLQGSSSWQYERCFFEIFFERDDSGCYSRPIQWKHECVENSKPLFENNWGWSWGFDPEQMKKLKKASDKGVPFVKASLQDMFRSFEYALPKYAQPCFVKFASSEEALKAESASGESLRKLEETLVVRSNEGEQKETSIPIGYYVGLENKGNAKLTEENVLSMLKSGMAMAGEKSE